MGLSITEAVAIAVDPLKKLVNKRTLLDKIGRAFLANVKLGFRNSTSPDGARWAPLKVRVGGNPLRDTGAFYRGIYSKVESANEVSISTPEFSDKWAHVHQYGHTFSTTKNPFSNGKSITISIPARPFMPIGYLPKNYEQAISAIVAAHLGADK